MQAYDVALKSIRRNVIVKTSLTAVCRYDIVSTSVRRHFDAKCPLGHELSSLVQDYRCAFFE